MKISKAGLAKRLSGGGVGEISVCPVAFYGKTGKIAKYLNCKTCDSQNNARRAKCWLKLFEVIA